MYTDAKGYAKKLKAVEAKLRKWEAADIAKKTKVEYEDALRILELKAIKTVKIGLVGFEQAWGQIATGAEQVGRAQLKEAQKQTAYQKIIADKTTITADKKDEGGYR